MCPELGFLDSSTLKCDLRTVYVEVHRSCGLWWVNIGFNHIEHPSSGVGELSLAEGNFCRKRQARPRYFLQPLSRTMWLDSQGDAAAPFSWAR